MRENIDSRESFSANEYEAYVMREEITKLEAWATDERLPKFARAIAKDKLEELLGRF